MKIVIDIPENLYKATINGLDANEIWDLRLAVKNGKPLPKVHGRLIDEERISLSGIHFKTERDHAMMIGRLNSAPTIIEANTERKDKRIQMTNNHIQTYTCENGARAKFIIPENATKNDLLALKKIVNEIIERKIKEYKI